MKAGLTSKASRLKQRQVNLEKAIGELPDDASGADIDALRIDLQRTGAELNNVDGTKWASSSIRYLIKRPAYVGVHIVKLPESTDYIAIANPDADVAAVLKLPSPTRHLGRNSPSRWFPDPD